MLPDRVSNPGPLTYESGALPIALRGPATLPRNSVIRLTDHLDMSIAVYHGSKAPKQRHKSVKFPSMLYAIIR